MLRRVALGLALLLLPTCGSSEDPPVACDALNRCSQISVNQLTCPDRLADPNCGEVYRRWIRCYAEDCTPETDAAVDADSDPDAGVRVCQTELDAWYACRLKSYDAAAKYGR